MYIHITIGTYTFTFHGIGWERREKVNVIIMMTQPYGLFPVSCEINFWFLISSLLLHIHTSTQTVYVVCRLSGTQVKYQSLFTYKYIF